MKFLFGKGREWIIAFVFVYKESSYVPLYISVEGKFDTDRPSKALPILFIPSADPAILSDKINRFGRIKVNKTVFGRTPVNIPMEFIRLLVRIASNTEVITRPQIEEDGDIGLNVFP